jgi:hypothetical protein
MYLGRKFLARVALFLTLLAALQAVACHFHDDQAAVSDAGFDATSPRPMPKAAVGPAISVSTLTALATLPTLTLSVGTEVFVQSPGAYYTWTASDAGGPANGSTVVAGIGGQWLLHALPMPQQSVTSVTIMPMGDSTTITSDVDTAQQAGSWRPAFEARLSGSRSNWEFVGTQYTQTSGAGGLHNFAHEGHGGFTISQINTAFPYYVGGDAGAGIVGVGCPSIIVLEIGTNDVVQGQSAAQMEANYTTLAGTIFGTCPNVRVVICGPMPFSAGSTPGANLAAWNTTIGTVAAWIQTVFIPTQTALGQTWIYFDLSWMGIGEHQSDGVHPYVSGLSEWGLRLADLFSADPRLFGPQIGQNVRPRLFRTRYPTGALDFGTPTLNNVTVTDPGMSPGSGSFACAVDWLPKTLTSGAATSTVILSYGTAQTTSWYALTQIGTQLSFWWGSSSGSGPLIGPPSLGDGGAFSGWDGGFGGYPGTGLLAQGNTLIAATWQRTVFACDSSALVCALYNNGDLLGAVSVPAWSMATNGTATLQVPQLSNAAPSFMGRLHCWQTPGQFAAAYPNNAAVAVPGTMAFAALVNRDYQFGAPLSPGNYSARYDLNVSPPTAAGQSLWDASAAQWNDGGGANLIVGSAFGQLNGPGFITAPRPWELGGPAFAKPDPGWN